MKDLKLSYFSKKNLFMNLRDNRMAIIYANQKGRFGYKVGMPLGCDVKSKISVSPFRRY